MGSTRLPGKVLMQLQGKPILEHIVDFLRYSKMTSRIVIATSKLSEDDPIEELAKRLQISCYRGSASDVLERYYECAKKFDGDLIVRITADDPLVNPELIDEIIQVCKQTNCDYATNILHNTYPIGICGEAFTFKILQKLHEQQKDPLSREHVTYHITQNPHLYNIREVSAPEKLRRPNWRLTMDYQEDFDLMSEIFSKLYNANSYIKYASLVKLLDENTYLLKINAKYN